jgi:enolase
VWADDILESFSVPSGASTGTHEAHELRDENGKGVKIAIEKINGVILPALLGKNVLAQKEIDDIMIALDGTSNKDNLGSNSMIGVSIAVAKLAAKVSGLEVFEYLQNLSEIKHSERISHLYMNLINGGKHANNKLAFQEYHIVSITDDIKEAVDIGIKIQDSLKKIITRELGEESLILGDEGGYAPKITDIRKPLLFLSEAIKENNFEDKTRLALDVASSSFFVDGFYEINEKKTSPNDQSHSVGRVTKEELMKVYDDLIKEFNLLSIEDPFDEEDFESFRKLKENHPELIVIGDDLTVTNKILLQKAIDEKSINAMIIKPNQIGTLTETLETMKLARENNIELIVSHRSGETEDDFISDLAYAFGCFGLKAGSPIKIERMVKYERLIKITTSKMNK